ncbi:hypothetical protein [Arthrobacter sp. ISL-65]|uniref:hypothetical protein n=1 Tax=Arthrobacter sp. ISL-65 TaxID=2819112 RepID=UPI001BE82C34|nr:hypothetical protein [Arthrobacter sp. ISL-65]MBT2551270.1 hypothetical protein [Arthrobacter sp. ISL-65]
MSNSLTPNWLWIFKYWGKKFVLPELVDLTQRRAAHKIPNSLACTLTDQVTPKIRHIQENMAKPLRPRFGVSHFLGSGTLEALDASLYSLGLRRYSGLELKAMEKRPS